MAFILAKKQVLLNMAQSRNRRLFSRKDENVIPVAGKTGGTDQQIRERVFRYMGTGAEGGRNRLLALSLA